MISSLRGVIVAKGAGRVVLEAGGVGYEVLVTAAASAALTAGAEAFLHVAESVAMYGGGVTLYGFPAAGEKELFLALRDHVPSTGAKKALEYLDRASKSLPDFRRAVIERDSGLLTAAFGFTRKTAERLVEALKGKLGDEGGAGAARPGKAQAAPAAMTRALSGLSALGYRPAEARAALSAVAEEHPGEPLGAEDIIRLALKRL